MKKAMFVIVALGVVFAAGFLAARITTPEELSSTFSPPPQTPITAEIERRSISQTVVGRGTVTFDTAWSPTVGALPGIGGSQSRLTWIPAVGTEIQSGQALLEISYRPIILLPGTRPLVRNLQNGDSGPDVFQLEQSLKELGHLDPNEVDGKYTSTTGKAMADLYESAGYEPSKTDGTITTTASELLVTSGGPFVVREHSALVGDIVVVGDLPLVLTTGPPVIVVGLPTFEAAVLLGGEVVEILDESSGENAGGVVGNVGKLPDETIGGVPVMITTDIGLPDDREYRVTIVLTKTGGAVLAVPEPAIFLDSAGFSFITLIHGADRQRIRVDIGLVGSDGWVEVITDVDAAIQAGDKVLIGGG